MEHMALQQYGIHTAKNVLYRKYICDQKQIFESYCLPVFFDL